ncbi:uncharacterized protein Dmoj_GI27023 [Drosophila mojavensis]|uniref:Uncharacterized protein n=1 Tax=Drosophila mojavensis TaxID=7230 RepID=A0A0Q9XPM2_DROMO|nr:uncharacterized protein Dmoj_GI27023 [Drosophila mojavensis]
MELCLCCLDYKRKLEILFVASNTLQQHPPIASCTIPKAKCLCICVAATSQNARIQQIPVIIISIGIIIIIYSNCI